MTQNNNRLLIFFIGYPFFQKAVLWRWNDYIDHCYLLGNFGYFLFVFYECTYISKGIACTQFSMLYIKFSL